MCVGDRDRPLEKARLLDPGGAGHLPVAVQREPAGKDRVCQVLGSWQEDRDAGSDRTLTDSELALTPNQCGVADMDTGHVSDRVEGAGCAVEWHAEIPGPWSRLRGPEGGCQGKRQSDERDPNQPESVRDHAFSLSCHPPCVAARQASRPKRPPVWMKSGRGPNRSGSHRSARKALPVYTGSRMSPLVRATASRSARFLGRREAVAPTPL